ncbi:hypothetical protein F5Y14DRAFT_301738 [Nemania sp. NC0429]|nr:hypothetical protein F5Y14DRAFT_301738 [Nemania sp. NC0429]
MQYSLATLLPLMLTSLSPLAQALPFDVAPRASIQELADAQNSWRQDTSVVSQFLSAVPTLQGQRLQAAAQVALDAENDELLHKKVLDGAFSDDPRIAGADDVLVGQGTFQSVVDALARFSRDGAAMSPDEVLALLRRTNSVRCGRVLPAIDTYFRVTGEALRNGGFLLATRPTNC